MEQQLLRALDHCDSNKRIAQATGKTEQTVRNQLSALYRKINVTNRTQAVCWFRAQAGNQGFLPSTSVLLRRAGDWANNSRVHQDVASNQPSQDLLHTESASRDPPLPLSRQY
jgi:DNA-binding CsgD family transcriptional regulator